MNLLNRVYDDLLKPSLGALWVSQAVVFAVYPLFAISHGSRRVSALVPAFVIAAAATALCVYGFWTSVHDGGT